MRKGFTRKPFQGEWQVPRSVRAPVILSWVSHILDSAQDRFSSFWRCETDHDHRFHNNEERFVLRARSHPFDFAQGRFFRTPREMGCPKFAN